jgi:hypothetical protein
MISTARILFASALLLATGLAPVRAELSPEAHREAIARHEAALVSIKYVMTMSMFGQEQRQEGTGQGVLVGSDGLILVPDRLVNFEFPMAQMGGEGEPGGGSGASLRASEFRVLVSGSEEWLPASFVTRAPDLELAWLRLDKAPEGLKPLDLDLDRVAKPAVGDRFLTVSRSGEHFGHAVYVRQGRVAGEVRLPRRAFIVDSIAGLAVDAEGRFVGVVDLDMGFMRNRSFSMDMGDFMMLLTPAERVAAATRQAAGAAVESP